MYLLFIAQQPSVWLIQIAWILVLSLLLHQPLFSQPSTATADASAQIEAGITLEKKADLLFGSLIPTAQGGEIIINPVNGKLQFNGVFPAANSQYQGALFITTGEPNFRYGISLPPTVTLTRVGNGGSLTITELQANDAAGQLDASGKGMFVVGARLTIPARSLTGIYQGQFAVTVQYE